MKKQLIFIIAGLFSITFAMSCQEAPSSASGLQISGLIEKARSKEIALDKLDFTNKAETLAETVATEGSFSFKFDSSLEAGIYRIRIERKNMFLVLNGKESVIDIKGEFSSIANQNFEVSGAPLTEKFNAIMAEFGANRDIAGITAKIKDVDPLVSAMLMVNVFGPRGEYADMHISASERLSNSYAGSEIAKNYSELAKNLQKSQARKMASEKIRVGADAPEIAMPNPDGKIMKLSDLKGKVVLLDFWASWCGPCRKANPHVVETYHKYKDQGFTVFSVSLDGLDARSKGRMKAEQIESRLESSKQRWLDAIAKDKLEWESHVSTLDKWDTKSASDYGVTSIPRTFLIDREGKIAAINPRFNLEEALLKELN